MGFHLCPVCQIETARVGDACANCQRRAQPIPLNEQQRLKLQLASLLHPGECIIDHSKQPYWSMLLLHRITRTADADALCVLAEEVGIGADWWIHDWEQQLCTVVLDSTDF